MSNVNLHLEEGAEIHFSDDPKDYLPAALVRYAGIECVNYSPLLSIRGLCTPMIVSQSISLRSLVVNRTN